MSRESDDALPAIDVLLVEDRVSAARQLARLLELWGASSVQVAPSVAEALALLQGHFVPALVLLDHRLGDGFGCVVALWFAVQPRLRQETRLVVYTSSSQHEVAQSLYDLVVELAQPGKRTDQVLGSLTSAERASADTWLVAAREYADDHEALFDQVYDAYYSKRLSIEAFREALVQLWQGEE